MQDTPKYHLEVTTQKNEMFTVKNLGFFASQTATSVEKANFQIHVILRSLTRSGKRKYQIHEILLSSMVSEAG